MKETKSRKEGTPHSLRILFCVSSLQCIQHCYPLSLCSVLADCLSPPEYWCCLRPETHLCFLSPFWRLKQAGAGCLHGSKAVPSINMHVPLGNGYCTPVLNTGESLLRNLPGDRLRFQPGLSDFKASSDKHVLSTPVPG